METDGGGVRHVAVAIVTYRRTRQLGRLLHCLSAIEPPLPDGERPLVVVVVDNDPDGSARATVAEFSSSTRGPRLDIRYAVEARPGIAAARNAAIQLALDHLHVAFIDDDEIPSNAWLRELVQAQARYDADVVAGPARPVYAAGTPRWVREGKFFEPPSWPTGHLIRQGGTNNCLIRLAALEGDMEPFDPEFGLGGAEDTLLCLRLHQAGRRLVWSDTAVTLEDIPLERASVGFLVRRALRSDNSGPLCELLIAPAASRRRHRAGLVVSGLRMTGTGLIAGPVLGGLWSRVNWVRALRLVARGVGRVGAAAGWRYLEYGRDGRRWVRVSNGAASNSA